MIVEVHEAIVAAVREILPIAQATLRDHGTHLPTAVLHTMEGLLPIVLPFKDDYQKSALVDYVKKEAVELHAFAVTTVTCARILDSRTGEEEEALVLATVIQGGAPHVVVQRFFRGDDRSVTAFGDAVEDDLAAMPGQMMIFPEWHDEVCH